MYHGPAGRRQRRHSLDGRGTVAKRRCGEWTLEHGERSDKFLYAAQRQHGEVLSPEDTVSRERTKGFTSGYDRRFAPRKQGIEKRGSRRNHVAMQDAQASFPTSMPGR